MKVTALPEADWPQVVEVTMTQESAKPPLLGVPNPFSDNDMAFYSTTLRSELVVRCERISGTRSYRCRVVRGKTWATDNYDWQPGDTTPLLPSDDEMLRLRTAGCAGTYRRSSGS